MDWNFTLGTVASGTINGIPVFENAPIEVQLSACRLASSANTDRHFAVFNGLGILSIDGRRFSFDPNRYGLLLECERQTGGHWLSVAFGTADAPFLLAGFDLPRWSGLDGLGRVHAASDSGIHCRNPLEALDSVTLEMAALELARGTSTPSLTVGRSA